MGNKVKILKEAKRIEEDSLYSSKGHLYAGHCWGTVHLVLGSSAAILSAIAGASALSQFSYHNYIAGVLSIIVAGLTAFITFTNSNTRAEKHLMEGNKYLALRNDVRIFYSLELKNKTAPAALTELKVLSDRRDKLNLESSQIPKWAFDKAKAGIEDGEAKYEVDR